ncbi:hypothetical protein ABEB36_007975 [Hypothenemus hampei]|uniref:Uncharacterized protein n=1 Tax=Hypothenemus hampei TaxID=57062 RepID=A0ABD1EKD5_HYPHA
MSVDVIHRDGVPHQIQNSDGSRSTRPEDNKELILGVSFGAVGLILIFCLIYIYRKCLKRRIKERREESSTSTSTTTSSSANCIRVEVPPKTTQDVTRRYERSVSALSNKSQIYLVPFSALPHDFDYSSREVEVKADYVILKDLSFLERYHSSDYSTNCNNDRGIVNEAYERQEPYNPDIYYTIPPIERDPYKKQAAYNPTFY